MKPWIGIALSAFTLGLVGTWAIVSERRAAAAAAGPNWVKLGIVPGSNGGGLPATVLIPPNAQFAISDVSSDPQLSTLVGQLNMLSSAGDILNPSGSTSGPAPAGFPNDGLGTNAYRATGTASSTAVLSIPVTQTTTVWIIPTSPNDYLSVITDAPTVTLYQNAIAGALSQGNAQIPGMTSANYGAADVDGNPANPRWVAVVAAFQKAADGDLKPNTGIPGFPSTLRTDGVLDYATALVMVNS